MSEATRVAEEALKFIRVIEEGNKAYVPHTLTYAQVTAMVHFVVRLAESLAELEEALDASRTASGAFMPTFRPESPS